MKPGQRKGGSVLTMGDLFGDGVNNNMVKVHNLHVCPPRKSSRLNYSRLSALNKSFNSFTVFKCNFLRNNAHPIQPGAQLTTRNN